MNEVQKKQRDFDRLQGLRFVLMTAGFAVFVCGVGLGFGAAFGMIVGGVVLFGVNLCAMWR